MTTDTTEFEKEYAVAPSVLNDGLCDLLTEALDLTKYAAAAFVYDEDGDGTPEWFDGLREKLEILQPKLIAAVDAEIRDRVMREQVQEQEREMVTVTREMAMDAGDLSMEGARIRW